MENKGLKKSIPVEMEDETLGNVSGGAIGTYTCNQCGRTLESTFCSNCNIMIVLSDEDVEYYKNNGW